MDATALQWYDHIELTGAFFVGVYVAGTLIRLVLERWIQKPPCASCVALVKIPQIEEKQSKHRETEHKQLAEDIMEIKGTVNLVLEKIDNLKELIENK